MKILTISDTESKLLWDYFDRKYLADIDLILACGDLDPRYLEFLVTLGHCPLLYVHGNHDEKYKQLSPLGCINIEDKIYVHNIYGIIAIVKTRYPGSLSFSFQLEASHPSSLEMTGVFYLLNHILIKTLLFSFPCKNFCWEAGALSNLV